MINLSEDEQSYYIPFENFTSIGSSKKITADDLTTVLFTFLPVEAKTNDLDLSISNVKFTKTAALDITTETINEFDNKLITYPNPTLGNVNIILFSNTYTKATISLLDITGKEIYSSPTILTTGKNEIEIKPKVNPGILFLKVRSNEINYGATKIIFR